MEKKKLHLALRMAGILTAIVLAQVPALSKPVNYEVNDEKGRDFVSFTSDAPIELIVGKTNKITGKITMDDSLDLSKPFTASFDVDLASIDTGIALRNEHMRDNFLETKKFPKATFTVKSQGLSAVLADKKKTTIQANGDFSLHGVTVKKNIPVDVTYFKSCDAITESKFPHCDLIQIKSTFKVPFADHKIKRPEVVFQKLADTVIITIAATAKRDLHVK